jgi:hypothetical protein
MHLKQGRDTTSLRVIINLSSASKLAVPSFGTRNANKGHPPNITTRLLGGSMVDESGWDHSCRGRRTARESGLSAPSAAQFCNAPAREVGKPRRSRPDYSGHSQFLERGGVGGDPEVGTCGLCTSLPTFRGFHVGLIFSNSPQKAPSLHLTDTNGSSILQKQAKRTDKPSTTIPSLSPVTASRSARPRLRVFRNCLHHFAAKYYSEEGQLIGAPARGKGRR